MSLSYCRSCDETFVSLGSFDAHQTEHYDRPAPPFVTCHDPRTTGKHRWIDGQRTGWGLKETEGLAERMKQYE